jgi:rSAM/selenodomain-associated transferase 1
MAEPIRNTLVVMAKAPVAGLVKTRLARRIGAAEALRFYRATTAALLRRVGRDPRWRTVLAVAPDRLVEARFWPADISRVRQGGGDLGARMQRLFDDLPGGPVVVIGSDIPGVRRSHVADAFRALGRHEAAFGPAEDGGYWLVGLRRRPRTPRIFSGVRWSSEHALADTTANLRTPPPLLPTLFDVDAEEDWRRWRRG